MVVGEQDAGVDDPEDTDELDLAEVEREICRLPDVSIARLVAEPTGRVSEVHVVARVPATVVPLLGFRLVIRVGEVLLPSGYLGQRAWQRRIKALNLAAYVTQDFAS